MERTSTARIITALIGVIITPIALGIISAGGIRIYQRFSEFGYTSLDPVEFAGPFVLQLLGLVLLITVVATGLWSSAGLIAAGALGLFTLLFAVAPGLLIELYRGAPTFIPRGWIDGIFYAIALVAYTVLGAMGLTLMLISRSRRDFGGGIALGGLVAAPVLLAGGGWLLLWGSNEGQMRAVVTFDTSINPVVAIAVIAGVVLTVAGIVVSRWSPWALVLPSVVLLLIALSFVLSTNSPELRNLLPYDLFRMGLPFVLVGGATAVAVAQLAFTAVALIVNRRAHRAAASVPDHGAYPLGQHPPASQWAYPVAPPPAAPPAPPAAPPAAGPPAPPAP